MTRHALAATLLVALGACTAGPDKLVGCWAFERRTGPFGTLGADMPDTIRLDAAINRNPDGQPHPDFPLKLEILSVRARAKPDSVRLSENLYAPWPPEWRGYYAQTAWRFVKPDSLYLNFHANMSDSWNVRLVARGDMLLGEAELYSDVASPTPVTLAIRGTRTPCRPPSGRPPADS